MEINPVSFYTSDHVRDVFNLNPHEWQEWKDQGLRPVATIEGLDIVYGLTLLRFIAHVLQGNS